LDLEAPLRTMLVLDLLLDLSCLALFCHIHNCEALLRTTENRREYLSVPDTARETAMSEAYWRKVVFKREIPVVKFGRRVLIRRSDLENFISHRHVPAAEVQRRQ
jgi:excisionase family DNA binding protein